MPGSLPPEDEIARLRVEKDQGASPAGSGCRPSDQAASRLALAGFHPSREELLALKKQIEQAHGPNRRLDAALTKSLPPHAEWRGRLIAKYPHVMAFTRSFEEADRFVQIALPGWDITLSTYRGKGGYNATLRSPDGNCDDEGRGATPALATLSGAIQSAIEEGGWKISGGFSNV